MRYYLMLIANVVHQEKLLFTAGNKLTNFEPFC